MGRRKQIHVQPPQLLIACGKFEPCLPKALLSVAQRQPQSFGSASGAAWAAFAEVLHLLEGASEGGPGGVLGTATGEARGSSKPTVVPPLSTLEIHMRPPWASMS